MRSARKSTPESAPTRRPRADTEPCLQDTVRLSADGLAKVLGDLEARVLRVVWALGAPAPARVVHARVVEEHPVAPLTVITVLNKLVDKRILTRHKEQDLYHYAARLSEDAFVELACRRVVEGILSFEPAKVAACVVDVLAEREPAHLDALAQLVQQARAARDGSGAGDAGADAAAGRPGEVSIHASATGAPGLDAPAMRAPGTDAPAPPDAAARAPRAASRGRARGTR